MTTNYADDLAVSTTEPPAVHEALAAVLAELGPIGKNGTAPTSMGGYSFRRVEDITAALKPLFAKHGLLCIPSVMSRVESQRTTGNNKVLYCVDSEICFRFIGPQGDELAANVWGQGTDSGDKAVQKSVTSAFKTMLSVVFCISDSESDAELHDVPETVRAPARPAPASKERIDGLVTQVAAKGLEDWVRDQGFPWPWTDAACDAIAVEIVKWDAAFSTGSVEYAPESSLAGKPDVDGGAVMGRAESLANEAVRAAEDVKLDAYEPGTEPF